MNWANRCGKNLSRAHRTVGLSLSHCPDTCRPSAMTVLIPKSASSFPGTERSRGNAPSEQRFVVSRRSPRRMQTVPVEGSPHGRCRRDTLGDQAHDPGMTMCGVWIPESPSVVLLSARRYSSLAVHRRGRRRTQRPHGEAVGLIAPQPARLPQSSTLVGHASHSPTTSGLRLDLEPSCPGTSLFTR